MQLFGQQGYSGTSMRDIANGVGMLPGSLYAHIKGKELLLLEIVDDGIGRFLNAVEPIAAKKAPADDRLREAIKAHVAVVAESPERSLVVFHQWRFLGPKNIKAAVAKRRRYEECFSKMISDGQKTGIFEKKLPLKITVLSVLGSLNWTPEWYSPDGKLNPDQIGEILAGILMNGLYKG